VKLGASLEGSGVEGWSRVPLETRYKSIRLTLRYGTGFEGESGKKLEKKDSGEDVLNGSSTGPVLAGPDNGRELQTRGNPR
jgi:hypothetical protein